MTITLNATKRTETGKASRALVKDGLMPAIVYGPTHAAETIKVSLADFTKILRDDGASAVVELSGLDAPLQVLIHDIDRDPVTNTPRHADFYAIKKGAKVTVAIPVVFVGESAAVKQGANMVTVMRELEVEADPSKLPHEIEVDISALAAVGDQIHVKDVKLPAGVVATHDGEEVVALIQEVQAEEEETAGAPDMAAIEVEQKGKGEEEADAAPEAE
jgi:large subunit ribosomal protein L25